MSRAYFRPADLGEAVALLVEHADDARLLAGGTAITLLHRQGLLAPGVTVDLARVAGLDLIEATDGGVSIGAMAPLRSVETSPIVRGIAPILAAVVGRVATVRVRNQATLGGNIAHADPAQDPPPILIALDAEVSIVGPDGTRRETLADLFVDVFETSLAPTDVLTHVRVPRPLASARLGYEKFLPRTADDYATVAVAARLDVSDAGTVTDARIVLGGVAAVPLRVHDAEALLRGAALGELPTAAAADAVREAVDPIADARGSVDYKRDMAGVWTNRLLARLAGEGVAA